MTSPGEVSVPADTQYRFLISTLTVPQPLSFRCSEVQASAYIQEPTAKPVFCTVRTPSNQTIQLELTKGVLTLDYCEHLLKDLLKCHELFHFRTKVAESTPGYYEIIKRPMDLKTLQDRLYSGQVTTVAQFKEELDLIWENCVTFNGTQHPLSVVAKEVQITINGVWNESGHPGPSHGLEKMKELLSCLDELYSLGNKLFKIEERPAIPLPKKPPKFSPKTPAVPEVAPVKVVEVVPNHQQRKVIADKLSKGPVDELRKAWDLLKPYFDETTQERQYLSLNDLPESVLIELKKVVMA
jgi:hypothetical protein